MLLDCSICSCEMQLSLTEYAGGRERVKDPSSRPARFADQSPNNRFKIHESVVPSLVLRLGHSSVCELIVFDRIVHGYAFGNFLASNHWRR
jgi:hypothetical protein